MSRQQRVEDLLRNEIASIVQREIKDPRLGLATVTEVRVSGDLSYADVGISVLGDDDDARQESVQMLARAQGYVRSLLAKRVRLRKVPELRFRLDRGAEHSQRISDLLESLHDEHAQEPGAHEETAQDES